MGDRIAEASKKRDESLRAQLSFADAEDEPPPPSGETEGGGEGADKAEAEGEAAGEGGETVSDSAKEEG